MRATVVDAFSPLKYADVVPTTEILSYFDQLWADLFDLPTGSRSPQPYTANEGSGGVEKARD